MVSIFVPQLIREPYVLCVESPILRLTEVFPKFRRRRISLKGRAPLMLNGKRKIREIGVSNCFHVRIACCWVTRRMELSALRHFNFFTSSFMRNNAHRNEYHEIAVCIFQSLMTMSSLILIHTIGQENRYTSFLHRMLQNCCYHSESFQLTNFYHKVTSSSPPHLYFSYKDSGSVS